MLVWEAGPFEIFNKIRSWTDRYEFGLFTCVWCLSVWIGAIITLSAIIGKVITLCVCLPFSLSAVASLLTEYIENGKS